MTAAPENAPGILRTAQLELAEQGAHLIAARTASGDPLFLSRRAVFAPGVAIRGGVPIIFPWFGDAPEGSGLGAHGFARTADWREGVGRDVVGREGDWMGLELEDSEATRAQWPHAFRLRFEARAAARLELALEVTNTGEAPFEYEAALHTYFAVADATRALVHGLEGAAYLDKPTGFSERRQGPEPIRFEGEVDRVYESNASTTRIEDPASGRTVEIAKSGSQSTIVWNPGPERGLAMGDLGEDWQRFVCVESGNVGRDRRTLAPGASERLEVRVTLS
ncbi:MAG: D-hexose-6-phosphate mutarotase [Planctomycetota bacterium]